MDSVFNKPTDTPKTAFGHCCWWFQTNEEGYGHSSIWDESRWYKCMVCDEYEMEPDAPRKGAQHG